MTTPTASRTDVRKSVPADTAAISAALAQAFQEDPVFRWVLPHPSHRAQAVRTFFELIVGELAVHDDTWTTTTAKVTGAALWVPYGHDAIPAEHMDQFTGHLAELSGPYADRMFAIVEPLDQNHPSDPHEYLWFLGVVPAAQGHGLGTALMAPVLDRADRTGVPCYLEATSPRNKALYERHGFRARPAIAVAGGPPMWPMTRLPA